MAKYKFIVLGIVLLLLMKYYILGLDKWNSIFHPDRIEAGKDIKYKQGIF